MADKVAAIIFDLGNVLVDFDHRIAAHRIRPFTAKTSDEIFRLFFDSKVTSIFEEGKIEPQDFFGQVKDMLDLKIGFNEFLPIWNEIFILSEKNREVYNLAKGLKRNYKLAVLSNINTLHLDYIKDNFLVFDAFHHVFASCELKTLKPRAEIYNRALALLDEPAGKVFYTDDRPELVKEAKRLGLNSFVFETTEKLKKDLLSCGIKIR